MSNLRELVDEYLSELDLPKQNAAYFALIDRSDAAPLLVEAHRREPSMRRRVQILELVGYFGLPEQVGFLTEALRDAAPPIWKEALNGLVRLNGALAEDALHAVRAEVAAAPALDKNNDKLEWIDEAIEQVRGCEADERGV